MGRAGLGEREAGADPDVQLALCNKVEKLARAPAPFLRIEQEVGKLRPGDGQGPVRVQALQVEGRHLAGAPPKRTRVPRVFSELREFSKVSLPMPS